MSKSEKISRHIHCKECGEVIMIDTSSFNSMRVISVSGRLEIASETLSVCKNCIIARGIGYYSKKKKKQPSAQGQPTIIKAGD